jgi:hypothetical protein
VANINNVTINHLFTHNRLQQFVLCSHYRMRLSHPSHPSLSSWSASAAPWYEGLAIPTPWPFVAPTPLVGPSPYTPLSLDLPPSSHQTLPNNQPHTHQSVHPVFCVPGLTHVHGSACGSGRGRGGHLTDSTANLGEFCTREQNQLRSKS